MRKLLLILFCTLSSQLHANELCQIVDGSVNIAQDDKTLILEKL
jgi:hypothetical protein